MCIYHSINGEKSQSILTEKYFRADSLRNKVVGYVGRLRAQIYVGDLADDDTLLNQHLRYGRYLIFRAGNNDMYGSRYFHKQFMQGLIDPRRRKLGYEIRIDIAHGDRLNP